MPPPKQNKTKPSTSHSSTNNSTIPKSESAISTATSIQLPILLVIPYTYTHTYTKKLASTISGDKEKQQIHNPFTMEEGVARLVFDICSAPSGNPEPTTKRCTLQLQPEKKWCGCSWVMLVVLVVLVAAAPYPGYSRNWGGP